MKTELNVEYTDNFVTKEVALVLIENGFDKPCIAQYRGDDFCPLSQRYANYFDTCNGKTNDNDYMFGRIVSAPTWTDALIWLSTRQEFSSDETINPSTLLQDCKEIVIRYCNQLSL